jgi:hypothetical protein
METCASESTTGSYVGCTAAKLKVIEPTLPTTTAAKDTESLAVGTVTATSYEVTITSTTNNTFSVKRASTGSTTFPCTVPTGATDRGGCPGTGTTEGTWSN